MNSYKLYITGPQKYFPNGPAEMRMYKAVAEYYGFEVINDLSYLENGLVEYEPIDRSFLDDCDIVIADVNPFRGGEPESSTIFDLGIAFAKKKKIYTHVHDMRDVIHKYPYAHYNENGKVIDEHGLKYADGYTLGNLMYMVPGKMVEGGFIECLRTLMIDLIEEEKARGQRIIPAEDHRADPTWPVEPGKWRAYLAGTECCMVEARAYGDWMQSICRKYNFEGIFPPDVAPDLAWPTEEEMQNVFTRSAFFFDRDQLHIRNSNLVIANLNPYHGHEPDSGTVFEAGMGFGLGYPCYGFISDNRPLIERINCLKGDDGKYRDVEKYLVEDYGFPLAARLATCVKLIHGDFTKAARTVAAELGVYRDTTEPAAPQTAAERRAL